MKRTLCLGAVLTICFWGGLANAQDPTFELDACSTPALAIPDNDALGVSDIITSAVDVVIGQARVSADITHTFIGDLDIDVTSPLGTTLVLHGGVGGGADDILLTWADAGVGNGADVYNCACLMQASGGSLDTTFGGESSLGDWTLFASDGAGGDTGTINEWCILASSELPVMEPEIVFDVDACSTPALAIPDNDPTGVSDVITVAENFAIGDLSILTNITHTWAGDVNIDVTSPSGATINLHDGAAGNSADIMTTWNDAGIAYDSDVFNGGLTMQAAGGSILTAFAADSTAGDWEIFLADGASGDTGTLDEWCVKALAQTVEGCSTPALAIPDNDPTGVTDVINLVDDLGIADVQVSTSITHTWAGDVNIDVTSPAGTTLNLHDGAAGNSADILTTWSDAGIAYDSDVFNGGLTMQAAGGSLAATFAGESTGGDWELALADTASGDTGTLDEWCVTAQISGEPPCPVVAPTDVTCSHVEGTEDFTLAWVNSGTYDSITINRNGEAIDTIDGAETTYLDENAPSGINTYTITGTSDADACGAESEGCRAERGIVEQCTDPALDIPDNDMAGITSNLTVADVEAIEGVRVRVDITHTWAGDLTVSVTSPGPDLVTIGLENASLGNQPDLIRVYTDQGVDPTTEASNCGCAVLPVGPGSFADLDGAAINGIWFLDVDDSAAGDTGTLNTWCVQFLEPLPNRSFIRGDVDGNGSVSALPDAIYLLDFGFNGGAALPCEDAADVDGDNDISVLVDTLALLNWQFNFGAPPASPFPDCGLDNDEELDNDCDNELCTITP